ncbi:MAG TPA: response regulator [archaeon]|nr:response regulator [archaeon]
MTAAGQAETADHADATSGYLVLVVEDNKDIRDLVASILGVGGFQVITAAAGADALLQIDSHPPDLILLDVMMPEMSGLDVLRTIRSNPDPQKRQIPVIMLTARSQESDLAMSKMLGATAHLVKPFRAADLLQHVKSALAKQVNHPPVGPTRERPE